MPATQTLSLVKGRHRYVFTYEHGSERELIDHLSAIAKSNGELDWFDAALLSNQIAYRMCAEIVEKME